LAHLSCIPAIVVGAAVFAGAAHAQTALPAQTTLPATPLDAVTSSATRTPRVAGDTPAAVSVVEREEIEQRQGQSIDDLLKDMTGVDVSGVPRNSAKQVSVRGLGDERVVLRLDGVRNNFSSGHRGRMFVDSDLLKQVDVVRGPSSVLYGSGALGGAVNLRTIDAEDVLKQGATIGGRAKIGYQTNNSQRLASLTGAVRDDSAQVVGNISRRSNGNLEDANSTEIPWSGDEIWSGLLKGKLERNGHTLGISTVQFRNDHTLPTEANAGGTSNLVIADRDTLQRSYVVNWGYASATSPLVDAKLAVYRNEVDISEKRVPGAAARFDETGLATNGFDLQNTARFALGAFDAQALTFGLDGYRDTQRSTRNGAPRTEYPGATQSILGAFVQNEIELFKRVTFTPGLRFDSFKQEADNNSTKKDESRFSPKASIAFQATPWLAPYLSYAEAFRVPSLSERFVSGTHFPGNVFVPNPNLKPETAANKEAGANLKFSDVFAANDRLRARAAYFVNDISDYIQETVNSTTTTTSNVPSARIQGAEAELRYDSGNYFSALGATVLRGQNVSTSQPLADTPADKFTAIVGRRWLESGWLVGARTVLARPQTRVPTGTAATGGYAVHDVFATYAPEEGTLADFRFDVGVDNVFDKLYRRSNWNSTPSPLFYEVGRNVKMSMSYRF
jgi:hemoglobin/transferrin/lactoferrin receptor protein